MTNGAIGEFGRSPTGELRGPACLGRSAIVWSGQPAPEEWEECRRVPLKQSARKELRAAWVARDPLVIEIADGEDLPHSDWSRSARWWEIGPGFTVREESLRFLAESNSVDARNPDKPCFAPLKQALLLGARPSPPGEPGDAIVPSGKPIWCDGGPLAAFSDDDLLSGRNGGCEGVVGVVPAANLAVGSLSPLTPSEPLAELAADQRAAVAHSGGGACIVEVLVRMAFKHTGPVA